MLPFNAHVPRHHAHTGRRRHGHTDHGAHAHVHVHIHVHAHAAHVNHAHVNTNAHIDHANAGLLATASGDGVMQRIVAFSSYHVGKDATARVDKPIAYLRTNVLYE